MQLFYSVDPVLFISGNDTKLILDGSGQSVVLRIRLPMGNSQYSTSLSNTACSVHLIDA